MQTEFYNQPVVDWARRNLSQPVEIKVRFGSRRAQIFAYLLLFTAPLAFILLGSVTLIINLWQGAGNMLDAFRPIACGGVMLIPVGIIVLVLNIHMRNTRPKFPKSLNAHGVVLSSGQELLWEKLYYVDHVSKWISRGDLPNKKIKDNQLELVFENGKAIIPPLIQGRDRIWSLVNSIPVQVRDDGEIRKS